MALSTHFSARPLKYQVLIQGYPLIIIEHFTNIIPTFTPYFLSSKTCDLFLELLLGFVTLVSVFETPTPPTRAVQTTPLLPPSKRSGYCICSAEYTPGYCRDYKKRVFSIGDKGSASAPPPHLLHHWHRIDLVLVLQNDRTIPTLLHCTARAQHHLVPSSTSTPNTESTQTQLLIRRPTCRPNSPRSWSRPTHRTTRIHTSTSRLRIS